MSKLIKTKKGFTIIRLSHEEAVGIWGKYGGLGICDHCAKLPVSGGYYIPVLTRFYCPLCYKFWYKRAVYYQEDSWFEKIKLEETKTLLSYYQRRCATDT